MIVQQSSVSVHNSLLTLCSPLTGITGRSILFELHSIAFPDSFPVDIMHILFENVAPAMHRHWTGTFFKDNCTQDDYALPPGTWKDIGDIMERNRGDMPTDFGRAPLNIHRHASSFKAEQWLTWIVLYSLPLLHNRLPERYFILLETHDFICININFLYFRRIVNGWAKFVEATKLCLEWELTDQGVENIKTLLQEFVMHYERYIFKLACSLL